MYIYLGMHMKNVAGDSEQLDGSIRVHVVCSRRRRANGNIIKH